LERRGEGGGGARRAAARSDRGWDFERIVLAYGDLVTEDAQAVARRAWERPLSFAAEADPA